MRPAVSKGFGSCLGVSEIASTGARLTAFDPGDAYLGEPLGVEATYENTGNVPFQPRAELVVRRGGRRGLGVSRTVPLEIERTAPGEKGEVTGKVELPGRANYELEVRLLEGDRVLSKRSSNVTPVAKPGLLDRLTGLLREHVLLLAGAVLLTMILVMAFLARAFLKLRRAEKI